ncbi:hypothetical protein D3C72_2510440 [compost metagenome]
MQAAVARLAGQGVLVGHGEAHVEVIPVLGLADGADCREVPFHLVAQACLGHQLLAAEQAADVVPLATPVGDVAAGVEL